MLILSAFLGVSSSASAALVEYSGANDVVGSDGVSRYVQVWMIFDDQFVKNGSTPPPVPGPLRTETFGHFKIISYTVHVSGLGVFAGTNGRLNIWYSRSPTAFTYYTEELEVLENHSLMSFLDGGSPWNWSPWFDSPANYKLPPELMIPRLNISPGYSYDLGNEIHLFRVCGCRGGTCLPPKR
ncbi:MAG TPA: hypothetical protein VHF69_08715 [Candidatus Synoicihabitans sp.]|nr:hypothetical protein [Candidatus Synoicihabitans sp.]